MKLIRAVVRMYWEWVADCCTDDIHELEECISYLDGLEYAQCAKELAEVRENLAWAEKQVEKWS